jgi:hypothetical protein
MHKSAFVKRRGSAAVAYQGSSKSENGESLFGLPDDQARERERERGEGDKRTINIIAMRDL